MAKKCVKWLVQTDAFLYIVVFLITAFLVAVGFALRDRIHVEQRLDNITERQGRVIGKLQRHSHSKGETNMPIVIKALRRAVVVENDRNIQEDLCRIFMKLTEERCTK